MADDIRRLSKQERMLWSLLENMDDFLHEYVEGRDQGELQPRLAKLDEAYTRFSDLRIQIEIILEDLDGENDDDDSKVRVERKESRKEENKELFKEFVNRYFSIKQQLLSKMESIPTQPVHPISSIPNPVLPCHTKYPELTLPTFTGKLSDWINFRDNFRSLIHDNPQLNDMDKFNYLRTSLRNDALLQINQIQVAAMNYGLAWNTLQTKYENHKLIAQEHMKEIFAAPVMQTESFEGLNTLLTTFKTNLQQLEKLGQRTSDWSTLLAFVLSQKLNSETYRLWETYHASKNVPTYEAMVVFLETQCSILQSTANRRENDVQRNIEGASFSHSTIALERLCPVCRNGPHQIESCSRFGRMRVIDRKELVRRLRLCFNCLDNGHFVLDCTRRSCSKCEQRHHYLLHPYSPNRSSQSSITNYPQVPRRPQRANSESRSEPYTQHDQSRTNNYEHSQNNSQSTQQPPPTNTPTVSHHTATVLSTQPHAHTAILSTAIVMLADSSGNTVLARALLDNGSQICLMTKELSQKLKFERFQENLSVKGVGGSTNVSKVSVLARIVSCSSSFTFAERKFYVLSQITLDLPQRSIDVSSWKLPPSISLADPDFYKSSSVDLVIGVSTFYDVLLPNQMRIGDDGPILQNSHLGWIVAGELPETTVMSYSAMTPTDSPDEPAKDMVSCMFNTVTLRCPRRFIQDVVYYNDSSNLRYYYLEDGTTDSRTTARLSEHHTSIFSPYKGYAKGLNELRRSLMPGGLNSNTCFL
ncbi:uncharacterized protein LOC129741568 [Uranotaenia lowii]|uniref:uncharacterized protein LOC129741568 n=1 Tax=Uranotaenia lowii TaxID=190385 RepID=UPI0024786B1A|nr:uncharacterized protein LOC129741568 [Uranotaenia lowii]